MGCAPSKSGAVDNHTHAASRAVQQMVHVHDAATTPMVESMYDGGPSAGSKAIGSVCAPTAARYFHLPACQILPTARPTPHGMRRCVRRRASRHEMQMILTLDDLSQGGTSSVYPVTHRETGRRYALKVIPMERLSPAKREQLLVEVDIM